MKKRKKKRRRPADEGAYICPSCGEQIVIPLDRSAGAEQEYVEDCPVCCNPNVIHLEFFSQGNRGGTPGDEAGEEREDEPARVWAEAE